MSRSSRCAAALTMHRPRLQGCDLLRGMAGCADCLPIWSQVLHDKHFLCISLIQTNALTDKSSATVPLHGGTDHSIQHFKLWRLQSATQNNKA